MDADKLSSDDILRQIQGAAGGLPEGVPEPEEESYGWGEPERISAPTPSTHDYEPEEYDPNRELADEIEQDHLLREQWRASETERMTNEFSRTGTVPRAMNFEEWKTHREIVQPQQDLQNALMEDIENLSLRYPKTSGSFLRKLHRGEIKVPEGYETVPNLLEHLFLESITPQEARSMDTESLRELFDNNDYPSDRRSPLHSKSADIAMPGRKKPVVKPRPRQQTYSFPDISQSDFNEMFSDWARKHPEKFRGR